MWAYESVFYQIYPLGFCGAPFENDGVLTHRILKVNDWIEHIKNLGANAIYFRTFSKTGRTHVTAIGFSLISTVIQITMTVFGTKAGRVISTL